MTWNFCTAGYCSSSVGRKVRLYVHIYILGYEKKKIRLLPELFVFFLSDGYLAKQKSPKPYFFQDMWMRINKGRFTIYINSEINKWWADIILQGLWDWSSAGSFLQGPESPEETFFLFFLGGIFDYF